MAPRAIPSSQPTTFQLEDGSIFTTSVNSQGIHHATCDLCGEDITLSTSGNPYRLQSHRTSCLKKKSARQEKIAQQVFLPELLSSPCPGVPIPWTAGSMWGTYPYGLHEAKDVGWEPIRFDSKQNIIYFRSEGCLAPEKDGNGYACLKCQRLPHTAAFSKVQARAIEAKEHTPWHYLNAVQQQKAVTRLRRKNSDYKRIMMLLSQNELPGLRRLLTTALKRGASAQMMVSLIERSISGLYRPRGGFNKRELDVSFLAKAIGGPRLLYALQKSYGFASISTVQRSQPIPRLLPSIGVPSRKEIDHNIASFFDPQIKPPKSYPECGSLPGNIMMFDGIAIETKCRYCPRRKAILGLCREHAGRVDTQVETLESVEKVRAALAETDPKSKTKVCFGSDATVVAVAPYADEEHYTAVPVVVSPSDKTEKAPELAAWLKNVLDAWKAHPKGEALHGPIWGLGSDGDNVYRLAKFMLCMVQELDPNSELGKILVPLKGLNLFTSEDGVVLTSDMKHIAKRFATLLRNLLGFMIHDTVIKPTDLIYHLSMLEHMTREKSGDLLDPGDRQNVPKAITLIQELCNLLGISMPPNPTDAHNRKIINFFAEVLGYFVHPFITVQMSLSEQVRSLSTYAYLIAALHIKHGTACVTGFLYADSQAVVKNIIFTIARMQALNPNLKFYILLEGTDRLEVVFCDTRTVDHAHNFDIEQLGQKLSLGTLVNAAFQRNPDLDRGHRRLKLDGALGIDHANPKSWIGNVRVGDVDLQKEWDAGREAANRILAQYFGDSARVNFIEIFSRPRHDLLRPQGNYVGTSFTEDDKRSEMVNEVIPDPVIPVMPDGPAVASTIIVPDAQVKEDDYDDTETGMDLDAFFPETLEQLDQDEAPLAFSKRLVAEDGKEYMKSSVIATLSSNQSKKATTCTLRVRGVALEDLRQKKLDIDFDPMESDNILKAGDLVATLLRVNTQYCLGVISVKGFRTGTEKIVRTTVDMDMIDDIAANIKIIGQIMELQLNSESDCWQWTGNYLRINTTIKGPLATHKHFILEFPSVLIEVLGPTLSTLNGNVTWTIPAKELRDVMDFAWQMLDPESEQVLANIEMLPQVVNPSLPYRDSSGNNSLHVHDVPPQLTPKVKLGAQDLITCFTCEGQVKLSAMRNHVGHHILFALHERSDPKPTKTRVGADPCGFCGRDGCYTQLVIAGGSSKITSNCGYHYSKMNYKAAKNCTQNSPCTNIPIHRPLCPRSASGNPRTIWKYNAIYHLISEHTEENKELPAIPAQFTIDTFIRRQEEEWMGITAQETDRYRELNHIPDSDAVDVMTEGQKRARERSESQSTGGSDLHKSKQSKLE
ncbi:hypothetical protein B0H11DRAFT_1856325 [Mycena galericulata]|nr:hypothetical protein B0H11DRAFT_1856325 [Mycena galericulata]